LLQEIATDRGWSDTELQNQIENRVQLLQYMADERITGYVEVASAIQLFDKNTAETIRRVESGTLTAEFLRNRGPSVKNLESMGVDRRTLLEGQ
jgi:flagellar protein FlaI